MKLKYKLNLRLVLIFLIAGLAALIVWPGGADIAIKGKTLWNKNFDVRQGLDLAGGARLILWQMLWRRWGSWRIQRRSSMMTDGAHAVKRCRLVALA